MPHTLISNAETIRQIKSFPSLVKYLRDELEWPIEADDFEDLVYDWEPEELGIDPANAAKIDEIKQLRPLAGEQPWGIFFVRFEPRRLPIVALRRLLNSMVVRKRATANRSERQTWNMNDLMFISSHGDKGERHISFAHFAQPEDKDDLPTLKVLGWDNLDTPLHLDDVAVKLTSHLSWPNDTSDVEGWRRKWQSAFTQRHRETVTTSRDLSIRLADLASAIRDRIGTALAIETERGPLTRLMKAFQGALVHDLDPAGFADMYAQTIAYGLLSARIADPHSKTADDFARHMRTNPFLRELMETFLHVGGRRGKAGGPGIDFDELGVSEVVELLDDANMEAVVRDFGDRNPQEDPVIHFYELFLKEYDARKRMQRGVFYTPRPVVSYIVRSVDDLLRTEFGLEDGLADTTTWGEMARRHKGLRIPEGVDPNQDFVQILDPATGTGTFLVEVIDLVHRTMVAKWKAQKHGEKKVEALWNEYVPKHLLTRLHGYELLMAPYAIAHLKIGLKLYETGYRFDSDERARIYLTNALEPAHDFSGQLEFAIPALAHEAKAANKIKRKQQFTIVIGNPPYSGLSANMTDCAQQLVDAYKVIDGEALNERKLWLQDDYVKFVRFAQIAIEKAGHGIFGYITNHGFLDNPTFRGMRQSLMATYPHIRIVDLHGNANKKERAPDGSEDKNVFEIRQGVAICLAARVKGKARIEHTDLWGTRESKYAWLTRHHADNTSFTPLEPDSPFYFFEPQNTDYRAEYDLGWKATDIFTVHGVGVVMARDSMTVDFDARDLWARVQDFSSLNPEKARIKYGLGKDARDWRVATAQADLLASGPSRNRISSILYRPFDLRFTYYTGNSRGFYASPCRKIMSNMLGGDNMAIALSRSVEIGQFEHVLCTNGIIGHHSVSLKEVNYLFPLWLVPTDDAPMSLLKEESERRPNLAQPFLNSLADALSLKNKDRFDLPAPEDIFHYAYAVFHSPTYRSRYSEFLKIDFPRLPLPGSLEVFRALALLGSELVTLHLIKSPKLDHIITTYTGPANPEVGRVGWSNGTVWLDAAATKKGQPATPGTIGFHGVPEAVWNFHIGGYQVCEKWLKDRKGRTLSKDDIVHYQKIVVALAETIRLMKEIDEVIDRHGGWPGAFAVPADGAQH